ncbi:DUF4924 family protein [Aureibacter tunicatorum]|uniref:DUF4924 domain-containing protein n=1 Tax=Aureibacter tunicatorum TaxID=866807 RepID=A0AAE3XMJ0_9BACT|nr:DUF4924 family protein [Aureibacter tunicatorum]MDR6239687.1 hypothetical protein [Aureibacter tunicatorum]BDD04163.1 hypothetical protein AUTU_16460 [Aureibacter tunicatorum]
MHIAEKKKSENISEYIIFLYKTEDLIRAFDLNKNEISEYVVKHFPVPEDEKEYQRNWYMEFCDTMIDQGLQEKGHIEEAEKLVQSLMEIHLQLLGTDKKYQDVFMYARPFIQKNIEFSNQQINNPIQICLNGVYGYLISQINGRNINNEQKEMLESFGLVLSYLSHEYKQHNQ